jgi:lipopolysaccharide export system permease protein
MWMLSLIVFGIAAWMFRSQYVERKPRRAGA